LKHISERRSDIFGPEEVAIGQKIGEDIERMKQIEKEKVIWDGHTASISAATHRAQMGITIEDQINAIHKSKGLTG
jgi:splicing factor 3A subunit 1